MAGLPHPLFGQRVQLQEGILAMYPLEKMTAALKLALPDQRARNEILITDSIQACRFQSHHIMGGHDADIGHDCRAAESPAIAERRDIQQDIDMQDSRRRKGIQNGLGGESHRFLKMRKAIPLTHHQGLARTNIDAMTAKAAIMKENIDVISTPIQLDGARIASLQA